MLSRRWPWASGKKRQPVLGVEEYTQSSEQLALEAKNECYTRKTKIKQNIGPPLFQKFQKSIQKSQGEKPPP